MGKITIFVALFSLACVQGQFFEDRRCRCVCPSPASVLNISTTRQIYTGNVPPNKCHCEGVVIPLIGKEIEGKVHLLCPRCECSYQTRNTTLIMGVVFLMLTLIGMAVIYMITLFWLNTWVVGAQRTDASRDPTEVGKSRGEEQIVYAALVSITLLGAFHLRQLLLRWGRSDQNPRNEDSPTREPVHFRQSTPVRTRNILNADVEDDNVNDFYTTRGDTPFRREPTISSRRGTPSTREVSPLNLGLPQIQLETPPIQETTLMRAQTPLMQGDATLRRRGGNSPMVFRDLARKDYMAYFRKRNRPVRRPT